MKKVRAVVIILILLTSGVVAFYLRCHNQLIPQGFAPVDILYHGSVNTNIKVFEPRNDHFRDENEGAVVFATPSLGLASCYLFKWDDSWVYQLISWKNDNKADYQITMVISDQARFKQEDNGGAIYILPSKGFEFNDNKGLGIYEWINKEKVKPLMQINFSSAHEAMKKLGVQLYFIEQGEFKHYLSLPTEGQETFLHNLKNGKGRV